MKLRTSTGEVYFNPQLISHVHLSPDHSLLTVHFLDRSHFGSTAESDEERTFAAEFVGKLTEVNSGFIAVGHEVLNLKSALWIAIPEEGPIQVCLGNNQTRSLDGGDHERIRTLMEE